MHRVQGLLASLGLGERLFDGGPAGLVRDSDHDGVGVDAEVVLVERRLRASVATGPDDQEGAVGFGGDGLADGAEQQAGEAAASLLPRTIKPARSVAPLTTSGAYPCSMVVVTCTSGRRRRARSAAVSTVSVPWVWRSRPYQSLASYAVHSHAYRISRSTPRSMASSAAQSTAFAAAGDPSTATTTWPRALGVSSVTCGSLMANSPVFHGI
jgi:hypothetical protein